MPKFISDRAASKATPSKVIKYVMNKEKCLKDENGEILMSTIGLDDERPYSLQFRETAELNGNDYATSDRKYYHLKISCAPGDYSPDGEQKITPEQFMRDIEDLVHEKFPGYQALITIQYHGENEPFLHAHIVLNASSYDPEQNKLQLSNKDLDELRDYAYEMGKPYGLEGNYWRDEVAAKREEQRQNQSELEGVHLTKGEQEIIEKYGKDFSDHSWKEQYRIAIREAAGFTTNLDSFQDYLKEHFHISTQITNRGNIKYKFPERTTYTSGKALGSDYTLDAVERALETTKKRPSDLPPEPTEAELKASEVANHFDEAYTKFTEWKENEYPNQCQEIDRTLKDRDHTTEYKLNKLVLDNTYEVYSKCQDILENEVLAARLTKEDEQQIIEMENWYRELRNQQNEATKEALLKEKMERMDDLRHARTAELNREHEALRMQVEEALKQARKDIKEAYGERREIREQYYNAMKLIYQSEGYLMLIIGAVSAFNAIHKERALDERIEELKTERDMLYRNSRDMTSFVQNNCAYNYLEKMYDTVKMLDREQVRDRYIQTINDTGKSIVERIAAAEGIRDMNIAEGRRSRENELYRTYGSDTRRHDISAVLAENRKMQTMMDVSRLSRKLGASNQAELLLKIKEEGRKFGQIKRAYFEEKEEYAEAMKKAAEAYANDKTVSVEEMIKGLAAVEESKMPMLKIFEEEYNKAKKHYSMCARVKEYLESQQGLFADETVQPEISDTQKKEAAPQRTKEEAEKARLKQWSELRDWADKAIEAVGKAPGNSKEANLKKWAAEMEKHGCGVRITEGTISLKHPDSNVSVRTNRLGKIYEKEEIINGIDVSIQQKAGRTATAERDDVYTESAASKQPDRDGRAQAGDSRAQGGNRGPVLERRKEIER